MTPFDHISLPIQYSLWHKRHHAYNKNITKTCRSQKLVDHKNMSMLNYMYQFFMPWPWASWVQKIHQFRPWCVCVAVCGWQLPGAGTVAPPEAGGQPPSEWMTNAFMPFMSSFTWALHGIRVKYSNQPTTVIHHAPPSSMHSRRQLPDLLVIIAL